MTQPSNVLTTMGRLRLPSIGQSQRIVAAKYGVSVGRQLREMIGLRYGPGKITPFYYYRYRLFDPAKSRAARRAYLGDGVGQVMQQSLTPKHLYKATHVLDDKAITLSLCEATDIACTRTQSVYAPLRRLGQWPHLSDADQIVDFLIRQAQYPIFGKPVDGRQSYGVIGLFGLDDDGRLMLGDDTPGPYPAELAAEIVAKFPKGYLFQDHLQMQSELRAICPKGVGVGRIETLIGEDGTPAELYVIWRGAGADGYASDGTPILRALLDPKTGRVLCATYGGGLGVTPATQTYDGAPLDTFVFDQVPAAVELAKRAHAMLPDLALIGWDLAFTETGPVIIEGNATPALTLYQIVAGKGVLDADFAPRLTAAAARARASEQAETAAESARQRGIMREIVAHEKGRLKN